MVYFERLQVVELQIELTKLEGRAPTRLGQPVVTQVQPLQFGCVVASVEGELL